MKKLFINLFSILLIATLTGCQLIQNAVKGDFIPNVEIYDETANEFLSADTKVSTLSTGYIWTEGPLWIEQEGGYLIFADIPNNKIVKYTPNKGTEPYLEKSGATGLFEGDNSQGSNGMLLSPEGKLVLLQQGDRRVAAMDAPLSAPASKFKTLASHYQQKRLNSPNDAVFHSDGSLYFTDPSYGLTERLNDPRKELDVEGLYRIAPNGALQLLDDSVDFPNGIGLSKDEKTLYVAVSDEDKPRWLAYDVKADGSIDNKRIFIDATKYAKKPGNQGVPDGMVLHSSGNVFMTGPGGVWFVSPEGEVLAKIFTGKFTANCTLSADEKTLYMTAHDTLMSVQLK